MRANINLKFLASLLIGSVSSFLQGGTLIMENHSPLDMFITMEHGLFGLFGSEYNIKLTPGQHHIVLIDAEVRINGVFYQGEWNIHGQEVETCKNGDITLRTNRITASPNEVSFLLFRSASAIIDGDASPLKIVCFFDFDGDKIS